MRRLIGLVCIACATGGVAVGAGATAAAPAPLAAWIQLAPGGSVGTSTVLARTILPDAAGQGCPVVTLDHGAATVAMALRVRGVDLADTPGTPGALNGQAGYPQSFVSTAVPGWGECEAVVPPGHTVATIAGVDLKLPVARPRRILVIADTGCRMSGISQQDCHDPAAFPFARLAAAAAALKPDLVLHLGDYFYRDTDCRGAFPGCDDPRSPRYEPWGDTFDAWNADFLLPAKPLLEAAPWVMVRGNHESCGRGARGWFALLDPHPYSLASVVCARTAASLPPITTADGALQPNYTADFTPGYIVPAGDVALLVHDSSFADDRVVDANLARSEDLDLSRLLTTLPPGTTGILATHRPLFGLVRGTISLQDGHAVSSAGNATEQAVFDGGTYPGSAFAQGVPATLGLFLAGHIHQLQILTPADRARFAPQMIVGVGGTTLDPDLDTGAPFELRPNPQAVGHTLAGTERVDLTRAYAQADFGFAVLDAITDPAGQITGYEARLFSLGAAESRVCTITLRPVRDIACRF